MTVEKKMEIVLKPIEKTVIFQLVELTNAEFFKRLAFIATSEQPIALNWAEGVLFIGLPFEPTSEIVIEEALEGIRYLEIVIFTPMPRYEPMRKIGVREIPIIDQSTDPYLLQIAKWLKERATIHLHI
jgi:hypothetical protein